MVAAENLVLAAVCVAPWPLGCAPERARYTLAAVLLLAAVFWMIARGLGSAGRPIFVPALGVPALGLLQIVLGRSASPSWTIEAVLVASAMAFTLAFVSERTTEPRAAIRFTAAALLTSLAQAAFGAYSWSVAPTRIYGVQRPDVTMPFGSFVNHNHFAGFVEVTALLAAGMALGHARRARQLTPASIGLGAVALALAAAHFASRSRGGLVALASGVFVLAGLAATALFGSGSLRNRPKTVVYAVLVASGALAFSWLAVSASARQHLSTILSGPSDSSASYRLEMATATLRLAASRPLVGWGLGAYEDAVPQFKRSHGEVRTTHAESDVLELLAEGGLAGVLVIAWLAAGLLRRFRERLAPGRDHFRKGLAIGAMSGATALVVHSFIDFNLRIPSNALMFAVVLGLASARRGDGDGQARPRRAPWVLAAVAALLSLASGWRALGAAAFEDAVSRSDRNERIARLDDVLRHHPYLAEAWRARGLAWLDLGAHPSTLRTERLKRAFSDLSQAVRLRPLWGEAWGDRGWVQGMLGDIVGAIASLDQAVELDPTHRDIQLMNRELRRHAGR